MTNTSNTEDSPMLSSKYRKLSFIIAVAVLAATIGIGACQGSKPEMNNATAPKVTNANEKPANVPQKTSAVEAPKVDAAPPQVLVDAGEFAENIYDFAKAKNWAKASERLARLEKTITELKAQNISTPQLTETTSSLSTAVGAKNEIDAMRDANQATFQIAEQSARFNLKVPVEVTKLDYYGREIEISVLTKDEGKLKSTATAIRQTWNAVKPKIEAKGSTKVAEKFESLVVKTEKAASVKDYAKVVTPILDEVDNLEKVFE